MLKCGCLRDFCMTSFYCSVIVILYAASRLELVHKDNVATEEFCPKSLLLTQNESDFIESHIQIKYYSIWNYFVSVLLCYDKQTYW